MISNAIKLRLVAVAVPAALVVLATAFSAQAASGPAAVSAQASSRGVSPLLHCPRRKGPCGPVVNLGKVKDVTGTIKVAARRYDGGPRDGGLCTAYSSRHTGSSVCHDGSPLPRHNDGIAARSFTISSGKHGATQIFGAVIAPVRSVDLVFRKGGKVHHRHAKLVRVKESDLGALGAPHKFSAFEASMLGCVELRSVTLRARSSSGKVLGTARTSRGKGLCDEVPEEEGTTYFGTLRDGRVLARR